MARTWLDPLARELWRARRDVRALSGNAASAPLAPDRAGRIAAELYRRAIPDGTIAWKIGAPEEDTQQLLGLAAPVVAPVMPGGLSVGASHVTLPSSELIAPRFELEVGVALMADGSLRAVPCVEVIDSRYPGWSLPAGAALADFGLQGRMLFGEAGASGSPAMLLGRVEHEGELVAEGGLAWETAVDRRALLGPEAARRARYVATGAVAAVVAAARGRWRFALVGVGDITVDVP